MANILEVSIPLAAQPQGSKNAYIINNRAVLVESAKDLKKNRAKFTTIIQAAAYAEKWVRAEKDTPVSVDATFYIQRPKTVKREFPTTKPDGDKQLRFLLDAISDAQNVWVDDSQVVVARFQQLYADTPSTRVEIIVG